MNYLACGLSIFSFAMAFYLLVFAFTQLTGQTIQQFNFSMAIFLLAMYGFENYKEIGE